MGDRVIVAGTAPIRPDGGVDPDTERQADRCLEIILAALREAGAGPEHVVRTRVYLVDAADWEAVGRAHGRVFGSVRPAATMVVVKGLLDTRWKVEMEAEAIIDSGRMRRRRRIVDLDAPDRFTVLASSERGQPDAFRLLAVKGSRGASAAPSIGSSSRCSPTASCSSSTSSSAAAWWPSRSWTGRTTTPPPGGPPWADVRAETLAVEWDDDGERLVIEAAAAPPAAGAGLWAEPMGEPDATETPR